MSSGGYLVSPSQDKGVGRTEQQQLLWAHTSNRLGRFLPNLMPELFPEEAASDPMPVEESPLLQQATDEAEAEKNGTQDVSERQPESVEDDPKPDEASPVPLTEPQVA